MSLKNSSDSKKSMKIILAITIAAVMIIPMLYSSIYLGAFWDPYGSLKNVPVAFVNQDKSVTKDNKTYEVGKELEENLKDNDKVSWKFVSYDEAKKGVEGKDYYAMIVIPEDFSKKIADAQDGQFNIPEVIYEGNTGRNFIFSQISQRVAESLKSEVSSNIQKEISKALVDNLYDVKVSIRDAGEGAGTLQDGTQKLLDGGNELSKGVGQAYDGSKSLNNGIGQLLNGSDSISSGLGSAANGSKNLKDGLNTLSYGEEKLYIGSGELINGLNTLKLGLSQPNNKINELQKGASAVSKNASLIKQGTDELNTTLKTKLTSAGDGVKLASSGINQADVLLKAEVDSINNSNMSQSDKDSLINAIGIIDNVNASNIGSNIGDQLKASANVADDLDKNMELLQLGTKGVSDGVDQVVTGLGESQKSAVAGIDRLLVGAQGIQSGNEAILGGLKTATEKTGELSNGLGQLNNGTNSLKEGLKTANAGSIGLAEGLNKLNSGSVDLANGLKDANDGAEKLSNGLNDGYNEMNSNLKFTADDMSKFVSEPVALKDNSINGVKYYGEGLAPYFVSLSLWLGAMFVNLIMSIIKRLDIVENKFLKSFIGKFAAGSLMTIVQALILSFALVKGLKIDVTSIPNFYLSNMFISVVFFSVMYGVSYAIGIIGTPIMFVVFLLQLSSSGGTFPIETAPTFYKVVGHVFPMTYSINTLRMIISGINSSVLHQDIRIMLTFMFAFLIGGFLIKSLINVIFKKNKFVSSFEKDAEAA
ncbi:YhgE/Pip family protein [Clostridium paridis]|uniref:YhgE/Pip domain-containing protein n=1 Tax=Clostridium paridis TaxID=2803863 RepID=A0A937FE40_9CLOT|nr:YhgE/Pip domain-containing protein [Clostridium paridis]MBL4931180.1 YhgE/Pip domain-containing protein [Clostridium paridis]